MKSVDSDDIAIKLAEEVKLLLASGGFQLTKFSSNSRKVLSTFCHDKLASGLKDLDLGDLPVGKAVGVYWNAESDEFIVHVSLREKPITRRGVLLQASQLFDPFGMIQPFILYSKVCCRDCQLNIGWDEAIPSHLPDIWMRWVRTLPKLQSVSIPRWFGCCRDDSQLELHCLGDTSSVGYGAVCYIRVVRGSAIHCAFCFGKVTRVSDKDGHYT